MHIQTVLDGPPTIIDRSEATEVQADEDFARLAEFRDGAIFAGSFSGHSNGDEIVQVFDARTTLTVMDHDGPVSHDMTAGMLFVVPKGR
ncbi:MAG: hypothetical protein CMM46_08795 [Rhodospirillaceae bacterium]|nr:hypothetical protein [Rhodospirillaceae bacterium]